MLLFLVRVTEGLFRKVPLLQATEHDLDRVLELMMRQADDDDTEAKLEQIGAQEHFAGQRDVWIRHALNFYWQRQPLLVVLAGTLLAAVFVVAASRMILIPTDAVGKRKAGKPYKMKQTKDE